jgi:hypothetical protein
VIDDRIVLGVSRLMNEKSAQMKLLDPFIALKSSSIVPASAEARNR